MPEYHGRPRFLAERLGESGLIGESVAGRFGFREPGCDQLARPFQRLRLSRPGLRRRSRAAIRRQPVFRPTKDERTDS